MIYYLIIDGSRYMDVKSVSFAPETDPTCASLPICEFEADVKTNTPASQFMGLTAGLFINSGSSTPTDNRRIADQYNVVEANQLSSDLIHIRARSWLDWLDSRTLAAELFTSVYPVAFLRRLFTDVPINDGAPYWVDTDPPPIEYAPTESAFTGYCPEQTARERLQWFCQAKMLTVEQWGKNSRYGLYVRESADLLNSTVFRLIPIERTYANPTLRQITPVGKLIITACNNFTTTFHDETGWDSVVTGYEYELAEDGVIPIEQRLYFRSYAHAYTNSDVEGNVTVSGNTLIAESDTSVRAAMSRAYFRLYEADVGALQINEEDDNIVTDECYYWPGDQVRFYIDSQTVYAGVIKSASFTFGQLAKAQLVISTSAEPVDMSHVTLKYVYNPSSGVTRLLCTRHYWVPRGETLNINNPTLREYVVNRLETFTAGSSQSTITPISAAAELTVYYYRS